MWHLRNCTNNFHIGNCSLQLHFSHRDYVPSQLFSSEWYYSNPKLQILNWQFFTQVLEEWECEILVCISGKELQLFSLGAAALLGTSELTALIFLDFFCNESLLLLPLKCWFYDCVCANRCLQWKPPFTVHSQPLNRAFCYVPFRGNSSHPRKLGKYPVKHREWNRALILHFLHCNEVTWCFA